jgi:hypothetical protein
MPALQNMPNPNHGVFTLIRLKFPARISTEAVLFAALLLLNVFFVIFRFFPTIRDINLWDDAAYINRGRMLLQRTLPKFSVLSLISLDGQLTKTAIYGI